MTTTPKPVRNVNWLAKQSINDVILDPDYTLTWAFGLLGPLICWYHPGKFFLFALLLFEDEEKEFGLELLARRAVIYYSDLSVTCA
jgi:hypothetical protein